MNNKLVLQNNNTKLENVLDIANKLPNKEDIYGQYIWKKYELDQTTFIGYVTSNNENAYPDKGTYKNYYYEKYVVQGIVAYILGSVENYAPQFSFIILYDDYTYKKLIFKTGSISVNAETLIMNYSILPYDSSLLFDGEFFASTSSVMINFSKAKNSGVWSIS